MKLIEQIILFSDKCPELPLSSKSAEKIKNINHRTTGQRYVSSAFFIALVLSALIGLVSLSLPFALVAFVLAFYFLLKLPEMELKRESLEIELDLPFFIREIGFLLEIGIPFENALEISSKDKGKLSEKIKSAIEEINSGSTFQKAISRLAIEIDSTKVKRAFSALITAYEQGHGNGLEKISEELLNSQRHSIKNASSKLAMVGLVFIAFSAIAPTFFIIYFILGGSIFQSTLSQSAFTMTMLALFPAIDLLILALGKTMVETPNKNDKFFINPLEFYNYQKRNEELEKYLPDALLSIASVPSGASAETAFSSVAKGKYGALSEEFERSLKQIRSKISLQNVLDDLSSRNNSHMLSKATDMLVQLFATNNFGMAAKLAEDFLAEQEIARERATMFSMQKYTLFLGAIIIPMILAMTISLSSNMAEVIGKKGGIEADYNIQLYLALYCGMTAYFSANMENKRSLSIVYFICLVTASLLTFNIVKLLW